jgi:hypothetical protein
VLQGKSGRDALAARFGAIRGYATAHPGRYAATSGVRATGPDDPLRVAGARVVDSVAAALSDYGIGEVETVHAIRTIRSVIHGFVLLEQDEGLQYKEDTGDTLNWMIEFFDRGLRAGLTD